MTIILPRQSYIDESNVSLDVVGLKVGLVDIEDIDSKEAISLSHDVILSVSSCACSKGNDLFNLSCFCFALNLHISSPLVYNSMVYLVNCSSLGHLSVRYSK
jgi:hypothetical protein